VAQRFSAQHPPTVKIILPYRLRRNEKSDSEAAPGKIVRDETTDEGQEK
jgi:hypothetical protein